MMKESYLEKERYPTEKDGLKLACLYTLGEPELKNKEEANWLWDFIDSPQNYKLSDIEHVLRETSDHFFFYQFIAWSGDKKDPFETEVVKAYWLADSSLIKPIIREEVKEFYYEAQRRVEKLEIQLGVTYRKEKDLIALKTMELMEDMLGGKPCYNFHTLYPYAGPLKELSKRAKEENFAVFNEHLEDLNRSLVKPGRVELKGEMDGKDYLVLETFKIVFEKDSFLLQEKVLEKIDIQPETPLLQSEEIKEGNLISYRFGLPREKISKRQAKDLINITKSALGS